MLALILTLAVVVSWFGGQRALTHQQTPTSPRSARPSVVENGTDYVSIPFPAPIGAGGQIVFAPDGTAFFLDDDSISHRVSPAGTLSSFADPHSTGRYIVYAQGNLWTSGGEGIVRIRPDGSGHRWYELNMGHSKGYSSIVVEGSDGAMYTTMSYRDIATSYLYRIDPRGAITSTPLPYIVNTIVAGANGDFYGSYDDYYGPTHSVGVMRFHRDGTFKLFPVPGRAYSGGVDSLAFTKGNLYFVFDQFNSQFHLGRLAPGDVLSLIDFPTPSWRATNLAVDFGGNLWLTDQVYGSDPPITSLYQYNIYTGRFNGPYDPSHVNRMANGYVNIGPDDNVWYLESGAYGEVNSVGVFVRQIQTLEPTSSTLNVGSLTSFSILETHFNGPWTAQSLSPSIVSVSPAVSATGVFLVKAIQHGSAEIQVKDRLGNTSIETVNAQ